MQRRMKTCLISTIVFIAIIAYIPYNYMRTLTLLYFEVMSVFQSCDTNTSYYQKHVEDSQESFTRSRRKERNSLLLSTNR